MKKTALIITFLLVSVLLSGCRDGKQTVDSITEATTTAPETVDETETDPVETEEDSRLGIEYNMPDDSAFTENTKIYDNWFYGRYKVTEKHRNEKNELKEITYSIINDYLIHNYKIAPFIEAKAFALLKCTFAEDNEKAILRFMNGGVLECLVVFKDNPDMLYTGYGSINPNGADSFVLVQGYEFERSESETTENLRGRINSVGCQKLKNVFGEEYGKIFDEAVKSFTDENGKFWTGAHNGDDYPYNERYLTELDIEDKTVGMYVQFVDRDAPREEEWDAEQFRSNASTYAYIKIRYNGEEWQFEREFTDWKPAEPFYEPVTENDLYEDSRLGREYNMPDDSAFTENTEIYDNWFYGYYDKTERYYDENNELNEKTYSIINDYRYYGIDSDSVVKSDYYHITGCTFAEDEEKAMLRYINGGEPECLVVFKDNPGKLYSGGWGIIINGVDCFVLSEVYDLEKTNPEEIENQLGSINSIGCKKLKNIFGTEFGEIFTEALTSFTDENGKKWSCSGSTAYPPSKNYLVSLDTEEKTVELYAELFDTEGYSNSDFNPSRLGEFTNYLHINLWYDGGKWNCSKEFTGWKPAEKDGITHTEVDITGVNEAVTLDFGIYEDCFWGKYKSFSEEKILDYEHENYFSLYGFYKDDEKAVISGMAGGTGKYFIVYNDSPTYLYEGELSDNDSCYIFARYERVSDGGSKDIRTGMRLNQIGLNKLFSVLGGSFKNAYNESVHGFIDENGITWSTGGFAPFYYNDVFVSYYSPDNGRIELIVQYLNYTEFEKSGVSDTVADEMYGYFRYIFSGNSDGWKLLSVEKTDFGDETEQKDEDPIYFDFSGMKFSTDTELFEKYFCGEWKYVHGTDGEFDGRCDYIGIFGNSSFSVTELAENDEICVMRFEREEFRNAPFMEYYTIYKDDPKHIYCSYTYDNGVKKYLKRDKKTPAAYSYELSLRASSAEFSTLAEASYMGIEKLDERYGGGLKNAIDSIFAEPYVDENGESWDYAFFSSIGRNRCRIRVISDLEVQVVRRCINAEDIKLLTNDSWDVPRTIDITYNLKRSSNNQPFRSEFAGVKADVGINLLNVSDIISGAEAEKIFREKFVSGWNIIKEQPFVGSCNIRINGDYTIEYENQPQEYDLIGISERRWDTVAILCEKNAVTSNPYIILRIEQYSDSPDFLYTHNASDSISRNGAPFPLRWNQNYYIMYERRDEMPEGSFDYNKQSMGKGIDFGVIRKYFIGGWHGPLDYGGSSVWLEYGGCSLSCRIEKAYEDDFGWCLGLEDNHVFLIFRDNPDVMYDYQCTDGKVQFEQYLHRFTGGRNAVSLPVSVGTVGQLDFLAFAEKSGESFIDAVYGFLDSTVTDSRGIKWTRKEFGDNYGLALAEKAGGKYVLDALFKSENGEETQYFRAVFLKSGDKWELSSTTENSTPDTITEEDYEAAYASIGTLFNCLKPSDKRNEKVLVSQPYLFGDNSAIAYFVYDESGKFLGIIDVYKRGNAFYAQGSIFSGTGCEPMTRAYNEKLEFSYGEAEGCTWIYSEKYGFEMIEETVFRPSSFDFDSPIFLKIKNSPKVAMKFTEE